MLPTTLSTTGTARQPRLTAKSLHWTTTCPSTLVPLNLLLGVIAKTSIPPQVPQRLSRLLLPRVALERRNLPTTSGAQLVTRSRSLAQASFPRLPSSGCITKALPVSVFFFLSFIQSCDGLWGYGVKGFQYGVCSVMLPYFCRVRFSCSFWANKM